jgi:hypothetical protein
MLQNNKDFTVLKKNEKVTTTTYGYCQKYGTTTAIFLEK